jgi:Family of unknown function (DUF6402)
MEIWFSRPRTPRRRYSAPETNTIRMDSWALTFSRAREVYDRLMRDRIWVNTPARQEVAKLLQRKGLLGTTQRAFGQLADPLPKQDADYINERPVGPEHTFDDMTAALGNFNFRVLVAGKVAPASTVPGHGRFRVEITEVGVYVRDSYDFEAEDQYLGGWSDDPDGFSAIVLPLMTNVFTRIYNKDFRDWRDRTGRGGDFLVFSDLKRVRLNPPDTFDIL